MIGARIRTRITFDTRVIYSNWNAMNRGPVAKAGNTVRKIAVRSIKLRADKSDHSAPGTPPHAHQVNQAVPNFKMIYSIPDRGGTRAWVGMEGLYGAASEAPNLQEYGGMAFRQFNYYLKIRRKSKRSGKFRKSQLVKKRFSGIAQYPARPFMRPALQTAIDRGYLPKFWANSLERAHVRAA